MSDLDNEQNRRIRDVEARINELENQVSAILAKLDVVQNLCKGLMILAGAAIGIDVVPMMNGGA